MWTRSCLKTTFFNKYIDGINWFDIVFHLDYIINTFCFTTTLLLSHSLPLSHSLILPLSHYPTLPLSHPLILSFPHSLNKILNHIFIKSLALSFQERFAFRTCLRVAGRSRSATELIISHICYVMRCWYSEVLALTLSSHLPVIASLCCWLIHSRPEQLHTFKVLENYIMVNR